MLYIITDGLHYKLGYSHDPKERLKSLQTANAKPLVLLATTAGAYEDEARYHKLLAKDQLVGEWFNPSPKLFETIGRWIAGNATCSLPTVNNYLIEIPELGKIRVVLKEDGLWFNAANCARVLCLTTQEVANATGINLTVINNYVYLDELSFCELFNDNALALNEFYKIKYSHAK